MGQLIDIIKEHQLLSGLLTSVISLLIGNFVIKKGKERSQKQKMGNNSKGYMAGRDIKISK